MVSRRTDSARVKSALHLSVVGKRRRLHIDANPQIKTICVSDITFQKSGNFDDGLAYFTDYKELFQKEIDVLFVSLPNYLAAEATLMGLEHGCHVFCEKPPAKTIAELKTVIMAEKKHPSQKLKYGLDNFLFCKSS